QLSVRSVTNSDNPEAGLAKFREFAEENKSSPLIKPTDAGFGEDVLSAGKKIGDDMVKYVKERVNTFKGDRTKLDELAKADKMIAAVREFGPQLEQFRSTNAPPPFDGVYKEIDAAEGTIKFERNRLVVLEKVRGLLAAPTDKSIEQAGAMLAENKLDADSEGQEMVRVAREGLKALVKYEALPNDPRKPPESSAASLLFVAPIGQTKPAAKLPVDDPGASVFLAIARGVLYAIDEDTGELLWAARVGTDVFDPPAVARVDLDGETKELAVVTSNVAGQPGLTGIELRTGKARWFQPLIAAAAGPAVVSGSRAYVSVRDELGSVFDFDLVKGQQLGRITLTQPIGPAALRPGTGLLYVPADARRVYVVDVGAKNDDGMLQQPKCVQIIATGHLPGTVRTPPLILGPAGDQPADRWMVLSQADGPTTMKLRAFPIAQATPPGDGGPPPELPAEPSAELSVPGWAWFPPVTDGERLAIVTDAGQMRLFGVNQPGNADRAMFPLPFPTLPSSPDGAPVPGFVVPAEEAAFWVLAGGTLQKVRLSLVPSRGLDVVTASRPITLGVPTQAAQMNFRRDAACFVVRSAAGSGFRAALISLKDGETRWQRQLGVAPAAPPIPHGEGVLLVDDDGGASLIPPTVNAVKPGETKSAEPDWLVASSLDGVTGPTQVAVSADGKVVHTVTPTGVAPTAKWMIRKIVNGKVERTGSVTPPAALAGAPAAFADGLLIPAADGFVYRLYPGDGKLNPDTLKQGLRWWEDRRNPDAVCYLTVLSGDTFLTSDGGKLLTRWTWGGRDMTPTQTTWEVRERIAVPPLLLPTAGGGTFPRLLVADVTGSVWMYEMTKSGPPVRRWRAGVGHVPTGRPTSPLALGTDANGRFVVSYVVDHRSAVCFTPDKDVTLWVAKTGDDTASSLVGAPRPIADGRWLIADLSGKVRALDGASGKPVATGTVALPGVVPAATGSQVDASRMLIPLSDGSAVVVPVGDAVPADGKK
ncbi:MAG TPA: PQQ-binding-like beta-propeller repeat protein, partial [Gemmataceae bacterium]|nr:PQQ-binding-like beta-propeller repeat protein [Gemmataceae bacterium]